MMEWLIYLLKVTACTALFFGFYLLFLRKLTFFKINRFYLLGTLLLSFIIPVLQFEIKRETVVTEIQDSANVPELKSFNAVPVPLVQPVMPEYDRQAKPEINWPAIIYAVYVGVASLLLLIFLWRLLNLLKYTGNYTKNSKGLKLISKSVGFTNCSFFNYVFIDEHNISQPDMAVLLKHEEVHARQFHSADKMMLIIFKCILWFNPIVYLYDKALGQVHEYEADEMTSNAFGNQAYANLLLKLAISRSDMPLIHNFVKNPIKDRIKMLFHSKSKNMKKLMYLLTLPVVAGLFWLFAVQVVYANKLVGLKHEGLSVQDGKILFMGTNSVGSVSGEILPGKIYKTASALYKPRRVKSNKEVLTDTLKLKPVEPKIISYRKMKGDVRNQIFYLENAVMEFMNSRLEAGYVEFDHINNKILARNASLKTLDGKNTIKSTLFTFDLNKGSYRVENGEGKTGGNIHDAERKKDLLINLNDKVDYVAKDSVKMSQDKLIVSLFGNAMLSYNGVKLSGSKIIYNKKDNRVLVNDAIMTSGDTKIKADSLIFDIKTKKTKLFGADFNH
ncbi:M56 family metallopeptidase [Pedobacter sp.]|uniref:M56 family metallopeptidase n=1 Tax=Pedobacter sp. TaxID=1411316 RepID=UPI0031DA2FC9